MNRLFGTDGIRGTANTYPIKPDLILKVAMASAHYFMNQEHTVGDHRFTVVIGKDTRLSGYMVENALVSGFLAGGANVILLGPLPTPAVGILTRSLRAHLGVMVSASHNPAIDNGIKFFNSQGIKISHQDENEIEQILQKETYVLAPPHDLGKAKRLEDAVGRYIEFVKNTFPKGLRLDGIKVVVDCAHGAAYRVAPLILWELGADVISLGVDPNGSNINEQCGATDPIRLQEKVLETKADIGLALDGDADRLIIVDNNGKVMDGDQIIAAIAGLWSEEGLLKGKGIVTTPMSNLGLERYLHQKGLELFQANVGDRYVYQEMQNRGCNLGGEQSGHIILSDHVSTGDGLMSALQILRLMKQKNQKSSDISQTFETVPQIQQSIRISQPIDLSRGPLFKAIQDIQQELHPNGRLLVRSSGTEPLIRIMAQGDEVSLLSTLVQKIASLIQAESSCSAA